MPRKIARPVAAGTITQLSLGLVWLGAALYSIHATSAGSLRGGLATVVAALPGVIAATLLAAAAISTAVGARIGAPGRRLLLGLVVGAVVGLATVAGIWYGSGSGPSALSYAFAVGGAGIGGGALAVLPGNVVKAGLWGTTWVFLAGGVFGVLPPSLVLRLGGTGRWFVTAESVVAGLVAAVFVLGALRVERHRPLWCLIGGAVPGVILLAAAGLNVTLSSSVLIPRANAAQLRDAVIVLAVGGFVALLGGALRGLRLPSRRAGIDASHEELARIGLGAGEPYGFVLAGGYALLAAGVVRRPSHDIDLFTVWNRRDEFEAGTRAIIAAYRAAGLAVDVEPRHDTFTRLTVSDGVRTATVELGLDKHNHEPVQTPIGPVLHLDDAVANKMRAIYERGHASDFIDIDAVLRSGRRDRAALLRLAERADITFDRRVFADALSQAQLLDPEAFRRYGLVGRDLEGLRHRFALWRAELLGAPTHPTPA